jgi:uncharacterized protein YbaP (TraB family)
MIGHDMKNILKRLVLWLLLLVPGAASAAALDGECRPLETGEPEYEGPARFDRGTLWKLSRAGSEPSWLFGTIHMGDEAVLALPEEVTTALAETGVFAMEVVPDVAQSLELATLMHFTDGRTLAGLVPDSLYRRAVEILSAYHLPEQVVAAMKPWAAFLVMSYPPQMGPILDFHLYELALSQGDAVHGLETMQEQVSIFNDLELGEQVRLLADTVCHYDVISGDFDRMRQLYLERDLKGLYLYGQRHAFADNALYERLTKRLLTDRNHLMAGRMLPLLKEGDAFFAVGAMHLPGKEGLLSLLEEAGFRVEKVY